MRYLWMLIFACCVVVPADAWAQRVSPSVRAAMRAGHLPGESGQQFRARLQMLSAMDKMIEVGAEASPTRVRIGPKYRGGTAGLALLKELYNLETFEVIRPGSQVGDAALSALNNMPSIRVVRLEGVRLGDTSLTHISRIPKLRQLAVIDTGLSDESFRSLTATRTLEAVRISEREFKGPGLRYLNRNDGLSSLQMEQSGITDASLQYLDPFRSLKFLSVADTEVTDEALTKLWNSHYGLLIVGADGGKAAKKGEPLGEPLGPKPKAVPILPPRPRVP